MRFFAHDGKVLHGPSTVPELTALPGFDGDTLVCPVGASDSNDWKPALAYPPFRQALLAPAPKPAPAPAPIPPPPPAPKPAPTAPCPKCAHANPEDARYCNACAARMDGTLETPPEPFAPPPDLMPAFVAPVVEPPPPVAPEPVAEAVAAPAPARTESSAWRNTLIAAFVGAAAASSALCWWLLRPSRHPVPAVERPVLSAPEPSHPVAPPAATPSPAPTTTPPAVKPSAPPAAPKVKEAPASKPAPKPRRAPKPKRAKPPEKAAPGGDGHGESLIESHAPASAPAAEPAPPPSAAEAERGFILPGIPRPVTKSAVAPPAAAPAEAEDPGARQVREQVDFCAQLIAQGAFADHFDTCLCADARSAAPYRGRRGFYATELKKSASTGRLETKAEILSVVVNGNAAVVKTLWKTSATDAGRESPESWRLEDGLWCRAP